MFKQFQGLEATYCSSSKASHSPLPNLFKAKPAGSILFSYELKSLSIQQNQQYAEKFSNIRAHHSHSLFPAKMAKQKKARQVTPG